MATRKSYGELLKDPRWQKKRLEILEAHEWQCANCGDTDKTLHVHHSFYERDRDPWDYPDYSLVCLCEDCHAEKQEEMTELQRAIGRMQPSYYLTPSTLIGYIDGNLMRQMRKLMWPVRDYEYAKGVASAFCLEADAVIGLVDDDNKISGDMIMDAMKNGTLPLRAYGAWWFEYQFRGEHEDPFKDDDPGEKEEPQG